MTSVGIHDPRVMDEARDICVWIVCSATLDHPINHQGLGDFRCSAHTPVLFAFVSSRDTQ